MISKKRARSSFSLDKIIKKKNSHFNSGEKRRLAFLDLMIESAKNGANLTDTDIKEEVDTIMFEGHDTTAAGSSFVLCLLGIHQNIQERVYKEIYQIFGDSDREATFNDTMEMKYLERVIMESLRMYPPGKYMQENTNEVVVKCSLHRDFFLFFSSFLRL